MTPLYNGEEFLTQADALIARLKARIAELEADYDTVCDKAVHWITKAGELRAENARLTDAYKLLIDKLNAEEQADINITP